MSANPKIKRRWIKQEKRTVRLLYRKGLLKDFPVDSLYWAEYNWFGKRLRKHGKHRYPVYMPEVHYCTTDYWGESDEHSVVRSVLDHLHWANIDTDEWDESQGGWPKSSFPRMSRDGFIKYLSGLPTLVPDTKINRILKTIKENE